MVDKFDMYCPHAGPTKNKDKAQRPNFWRASCEERYELTDPDGESPCHPGECLIPVKELWDEITQAVFEKRFA